MNQKGVAMTKELKERYGPGNEKLDRKIKLKKLKMITPQHMTSVRRITSLVSEVG